MTTVLDCLNLALRQALQDDGRVLILGEDILDPYGGAFKVTRGLSTAYPWRILGMPISEAGFTAAAVGMALRGLRPVVEIMFGDFTTLVVDQLANHAAKFAWMYNGQVSVPLVVRAPMGGRRSYGPTHSQTLEKLFLGVPGLSVLAPLNLPGETPARAGRPESPGNPFDLLYGAILDQDGPVMFVENKLQYLLPILDGPELDDLEIERYPEASFPAAAAYRLRLRGAPPPTFTLAAYGYMADLARQALLELAYEAELFGELVVFNRLAPSHLEPLLESVRQTRRLLVVEEGSLTLGWGAEVAARAAEALGPRLSAVRRLAAADLPLPASAPLEQAVLPGVADIVTAAKMMV
jgi:acetoin:2,6-dichlorophenolindophenol oxidoreductase subunit beta